VKAEKIIPEFLTKDGKNIKVEKNMLKYKGTNAKAKGGEVNMFVDGVDMM
jgi:hypothetical protein